MNAQQLIAVSPEFHTSNIPSKLDLARTVTLERDATTIPYKSVVFLMLAGGADSWNMLVPDIGQCQQGMNSKNQTVDTQYQVYRDVMALSYPSEFSQSISTVGQGQPCDRFVVHPELTFLKQLYEDEDLVFFANTGVVNQNDMTRSNFQIKTRTQLFAHNAMQEETKKVDPYDIRTGTGVLGRAKDKLKLNGHVVDGLNIDQASILLDGVPGASDASFVVPRGTVSTFARRPILLKTTLISRNMQVTSMVWWMVSLECLLTLGQRTC